MSVVAIGIDPQMTLQDKMPAWTCRKTWEKSWFRGRLDSTRRYIARTICLFSREQCCQSTLRHSTQNMKIPYSESHKTRTCKTSNKVIYKTELHWCDFDVYICLASLFQLVRFFCHPVNALLYGSIIILYYIICSSTLFNLSVKFVFLLWLFLCFCRQIHWETRKYNCAYDE